MRVINIIFSFLFLLLLSEVSFAEPGIKIIQPQDNSIVNPGQQITVTVEAVDGFVINYGTLGVSNFFVERFSTLPVTFTVMVPSESFGVIPVWAIAKDVSKNAAGERIALKVQQTAALQSLKDIQDRISIDLDWDGNIKGGKTGYIATVYGIYSDGIRREIPKEEVIYISSDPTVISIDNKGKYIVHKVGEAIITVSNSGVSKAILVVFDKPTGLRPSEFIPPTTQISIMPLANQAGWNNSDIIITLTAQDNEGGSGVQEIDYRFPRFQGKSEYKQGNGTVVNFSKEGEHEFWYYSRDNESNQEDTHSKIIRLDKTSPAISYSILPLVTPSGWNNSDATVTFSATDKLSGIKNVTQPVTVTTEGANQVIKGEAIDIADNKAVVQVSLNIDKTLPKITLELKPLKGPEEDKKGKDKNEKEDEKEEKGNWYQFACSSQDSLSGLKNINCGLSLPSLTGFKQKLMVKNKLKIEINQKEKEVKVDAPNPQEILRQLQSGLFSLNDRQVLQLKLKKQGSEWMIEQKQHGMKVEAPLILFKATASDLAGNQAIKELKFKEEKKKNRD